MRKETVGRKGFAAAIAAACLIAAVVLLATSAGGSNGSYTVRAIFDDAGNIIPGEVVKIAGVKVGKVGSVTPTPNAKAAVTLDISNPGFQDFRADASCEVRPQALIGEKYIDCLPTAAARRRHAAAAAAEEDPVRRGRLRPVPAPGQATRAARSTSTCSATSAGCPNASD